MRDYSSIEATDLVKSSRAVINNNFASLRSNFSGEGTYTGVVGQIYHNATDDTWRAMKSDNTTVEICTDPATYVRKTGTNTITGNMTVTGNITGSGFYYGTTPLVHEIKLGTTTCTNVNGVVTIPATAGVVKSVNGYLPTDTGAVTISAASARASSTDLGLMSKAESTKLAGLSNYSLPTASSTTLGGVKIGSNMTISNGVLGVATASASTAGVVKVGNGLSISNGILSAITSLSLGSSGYILLGGGLQICWKVYDDGFESYHSWEIQTATDYSNNVRTWTFPRAFSSKPCVLYSTHVNGFNVNNTDSDKSNITVDAYKVVLKFFCRYWEVAEEGSGWVQFYLCPRVSLIAIGKG